MNKSEDYLKDDINAPIIANQIDTSSNDINHASSDFIDNGKDLINKNLKFWFLIIICMGTLGSYFAYDNPGALEKQIIEVKSI